MGSSRINAVRQRLAFDIDTGYDEVMTDASRIFLQCAGEQA